AKRDDTVPAPPGDGAAPRARVGAAGESLRSLARAAVRRASRRPSPDVVRRRRLAAGAVAAVGVVFLWLLVAFFQPFGGGGEGKVVVTIPNGASASEVGEILEEKGVISGGPPFVSGSTLFRWRLTMAGKQDDIPSGSYTLASGMSYGAAIDELTASPAERGITVVIPEGYTREQIAGVADDVGLKGDYMRASKSSNAVDLKRYGAKGAPSLEGFLYPATYELKPGASADDLVAQQLAAFEQNFRKVDLKYAESKNLTPYDVLTIASMIDREVQIPRERPLVGEVIYNRLEIGEPLSIDATIRYATGNFDRPLKESELAIDSPYNTRLVAGLPPSPIGNPGLDAIEAAADPGRGDNRFYVVKPGTCGEHVFTDSEREFNEAADRYQRALEREGGSPTEC
ncbi:MAG TPA: endolytic transglycosylase MltG, partial [Solirubrobacterales bacterium]|nr:endolytic transglycosylase MltG [Solirubrobacterales bacterium]